MTTAPDTLTPRYAARVTALTAVSDWTPKTIGILILLVLGRSLGPQALATYTLALAWITLAWTLTDQGLGGYGIRLVAAGTDGRAGAGEILSAYCVTSVVVWFAATGVAVAATDPPLRGTVAAMALFVLAYAAYPDWLLRGLGALPVLALANWGTIVLWSGLVAVAVAAASVEVAALAYAVSPVAGAAVAWYWLRSRGWRLTPWLPVGALIRRLRASVEFALGGMLGGLAPVLMYTTVVQLAAPAAAASLALGHRVSGAAAGAGWIALQNMLPGLVRGSCGGAVGASGRAGRSLAAAAIPGLTATVAGAVLWPTVIRPYLGADYRDGGPLFLAGVAFLIPFGVKYLVEIRLLAAFRDRARTAVGAVSLSGTAAACGVAVLAGSAWFAVLGFAAAELAAAGVGLRLLTGHSYVEKRRK